MTTKLSKELQQNLLDIVPAGGIEIREVEIPFEAIIPPDNAPLPDPGFVAKVERWALIDRMKVVEAKNKKGASYKEPKYRLVAGRRRYRAICILRARDEEQKTRFERMKVDEYINLPAHMSEAAITLLENNQRSPNPLADAEAVRELREDNKLEPQVVTYLTGLSAPQQTNALRLFRMLPEFRELVIADKLKVNLAERIAKLPEDAQRRVLATYEKRLEDGDEKTTQRLIAADFEQARSVDRERVVSGQPERLFQTGHEEGSNGDGAGEEGEDEPVAGRFAPRPDEPWQESALRFVGELERIIPPGEITVLLQDLRERVEAQP